MQKGTKAKTIVQVGTFNMKKALFRPSVNIVGLFLFFLDLVAILCLCACASNRCFQHGINEKENIINGAFPGYCTTLSNIACMSGPAYPGSGSGMFYALVTTEWGISWWNFD